ncbi:3',5'-cyclic-nucleotide phosphodiesterase [Geosmithia morbida]|uniref:Phosphodiesterase n=1 Tax=Geosmithia morbida TaxID=1094350 RepID=A0A9P4YYS9_9HYPO|nr:3',5'-cyclic-nucleotide phosphodiesterase [Geosmithia morbida]KAF4124153.1 3',5'-cyclic-nucleotide phosphodiesterase [Geosmithia morbida]
MDTTPACHVVYVDRTIMRDCPVLASPSNPLPADWQRSTRQVVQALVEVFGNVQVCGTGSACLSKVFEPYHHHMVEMKPTVVLLDTPNDDSILRDYPRPTSSSSTTSPSRRRLPASEVHTPDNELQGLDLMQKLIVEARLRNIAKLVVPVPIIRQPELEPAPAEPTSTETAQAMTDGAVEHQPMSSGLANNRDIIRRCLELGAADVVIGPLSQRCIATLETCAYRAHRDAIKEHEELLEIKRGRQRSWVGVSDEKPFAYLREAMVSGLMKRICRLGPEDSQITGIQISVSSERQAEIADAVGHWHFSAHLFTDDELVVASMIMFKHTLSMPDLEKWRIPTDQLINFLAACRTTYNNFVPYHNFRHVVDVLQATFNFLVHIGSIAPYPGPLGGSAAPTEEKSPIGSLIEPFEALTLLITAIGHDVGHPGVNNGFLVTLNAPLAQLYNDRSVLESFHCAAYSQILRRYWPVAFEDCKMRKLMISSILATDMGLHFDYMKKLGDTQEKLQENNSTDGWNGRQIEEQKALACSLLIKCADISNVARRYDAAVQWMHILSEEFSRQASMEDELQIPSALMAPPKKDISSLVKAQLGFMNLFAIPLFQGVADVMPGMMYTVEELDINKGLFERMVEEEKMKELQDETTRHRLLKEAGTFSPRTMSFAVAETQESRRQSTVQTQQDSNNKMMTVEDAAEAPAEMPSSYLRSERQEETRAMPVTPQKPSTTATTDGSGNISSFDAVLQLANSDPFNSNGAGGLFEVDAQRCSEATEGSFSAGLTGDWASQATSANTGMMPISPSTQGTSIVSRESTERLPCNESTPEGTPRAVEDDRSLSITVAGAATPAMGSSPSSTMMRYEDGSSTNDFDMSTSVGSLGKAEGKSLRKKPSRFRMRDFPFFKRNNKGANPSPPPPPPRTTDSPTSTS